MQQTAAWRFAMLYVASALGGMYLYGYEWLRFFTYFGSWGTVGLFLSIAALYTLAYVLIKYCREQQIDSLAELCARLTGASLGTVFPWLLYVGLLAYCGTVLGQYAKLLPNFTTSLFFLFLLLPCVLSFWFIEQIAARFVWLILVCWGCFVCLMISTIASQGHVPVPVLTYQLNTQWLWHALFYLGLHFILLLTLSIPLARRSESFFNIRVGLLSAGALHLATALLGHLALLSYWHDLNGSPVPFYELFSKWGTSYALFYGLLSLGQTIVTISCCLYGMAVPLSEKFELRQSSLLVVMLTLTVAAGMLSLQSPSFGSIVQAVITYAGFALLFLFYWKRR
ncbi:hypothetical protein [Brevibacillus fulvus]|uniref:Membrane protein YkvI n=1 Tax=Brevibacillus fulvus TaxID=1125967 RepID=A0A939BQI8_9BACL|nr:hypothetical protein [Brevibacillus fulvus]MBM7588557.1 putative membrane protein YkvI [Brevibacillus fulvus]